MYRANTLVGISAGMMLLAHSPTPLWPLIFFSIPLFIAGIHHAKTNRESVYLGVVWGVIVMGGLQTWILALYPFATRYILVPAWAIYSLVLAIPYGLIGLTIRYLYHRRILITLFLPPVWVLLEWLRTIGPFGNPTGLLAYWVIELGPLSEIAQIAGVYGVSLVVITLCTVIWDARNGINLALLPPLGIILGLIGTANFTHPGSTPSDVVKVTTIQGNDRQQSKFNPVYWHQILSEYSTQIEASARTSPDIIVLPETILPTITLRFPQWRFLLEKTRIPIAWGSPINVNNQYYNALIVYHRHQFQTYKKQQLMPFGEYTPFRPLLTTLGVPLLSDGDYTPGPLNQQPIQLSQHARIGSIICLEATTPKYARHQSQAGCTVLFVIANNAWFIGSTASDQFATMVRYRAIETHRHVVVATNTGPSGVVSPTGQWSHRLPDQKLAAITASVPLLTQNTIYTQIGDWILWVCGGWILISTGVTQIYRRKLVTKTKTETVCH